MFHFSFKIISTRHDALTNEYNKFVMTMFKAITLTEETLETSLFSFTVDHRIKSSEFGKYVF